MMGPGLTRPSVGRYLRHSDVTPLVRASRSRFDVACLPPYGDPEVSLVGEAATYAAAGAAAVEVLDRMGD